jgi:hypothetical protein
MSKPTVYLTRHTLSSLFEDSLKLLKPTWKQSLIANAIIYVPIAVISAFFFQTYFNTLLDIMRMSESGAPDAGQILGKFLPFLGFVLVYAAIAAIAGSYATAVVSRNAFKAASGEAAGWRSLMAEVLGRKFGRLVSLLVVETLVLFGACLVATVLLTLFIVLATLKIAVVLFVILAVLGYLALIFLLVAAQTVLQLGIPAVANEDISGPAAFAKCFTLAKGQFWRLLGISILFSLALSFAMSMVTMPLQFASIAPFYAKILESALGDSAPNSSELLMEMSMAFKNMGVFIALLMAVQSVLQGMVEPVFSTLFYVDLRVRKGDLEDKAAPPAPAPAPAPDPVGPETAEPGPRDSGQA